MTASVQQDALLGKFAVLAYSDRGIGKVNTLAAGVPAHLRRCDGGRPVEGCEHEAVVKPVPPKSARRRRPIP